MPERPPGFHIRKELQNLKLLLPEVTLVLIMFVILVAQILVALPY
ncbi:hypothetical protein [Caldicellulosiruptor morganii]|uniref:Uncharacterized protein n=1 Tax=Caldicellulosiruptor morganii TaxID=1387555 RepID=A0ABY7BPH6_9FIRM|nr:hypothetical protein [Caldicellulosiruptor morganii]WAM33797.1 hypothetical protein OTK00_002340 [Caldicellulosiruptor morganii]